MNNHIVEAGDVHYSKLTHVLSFKIACNAEAIRMVEDIAHRNDMTSEEIAEEMRKLLEQAIYMSYHRVGLRRPRK